MPVYRGALGRRPPTDNRHLLRYSLTAETLPKKPTPVVLGTNWYTGFDELEERDGGWWFRPRPLWGRLRGGHAYVISSPHTTDKTKWWRYYDQRAEGACVGFAVARALSHLNDDLYDGRRIYHEALKIDEWPGEDDSGTSVRAGLDVVQEQGAYKIKRGKSAGPFPKEGIKTFRWARSVTDIARCLDPKHDGKHVLDIGYVVVRNSWGEYWPHETRMDLDVLERLVFREDGDASVITDH